MELTKTELAEIVSTRTCHDLIGNIGTLKNLLDFIVPGEITDEQSKGLLQDVSFLLNARQKFFRVAFGLANQTEDKDALQNLCTDYVSTIGTHGYPVKLELHGHTPQLAKPVCLCVMIAADIFIRSGTIDININQHNITISATTDFKFNDSIIAGYELILHNQKPEKNLSQFAQLIYLRQLLGNDVPMQIEASTQDFKLIIG